LNKSQIDICSNHVRLPQLQISLRTFPGHHHEVSRQSNLARLSQLASQFLSLEPTAAGKPRSPFTCSIIWAILDGAVMIEPGTPEACQILFASPEALSPGGSVNSFLNHARTIVDPDWSIDEVETMQRT
jgi:hypothetical protein